MERTNEQAIRDATAALLGAVNTSDLDAVVGVWDQSGILMPPGHPSVHGQLAIRAYFERLFQQSRFEFVFSSSRISIDGHLAIERVEYSVSAQPLTGGEAHEDHGKGVHIYRRLDDSWKLLMDIWNSDSPR